MNIDKARRAAGSLEDVFTADEWAVVIEELMILSATESVPKHEWAKVTGATEGNPYFESWVKIETLTAAEDLLPLPLNPYAQALKGGHYSKILLCTNCVMVAVNGDDSGRDERDPEPLTKITEGELTVDDGDSEFRWDTPCDGCGETDDGDRYAATLVYVEPPRHN